MSEDPENPPESGDRSRAVAGTQLAEPVPGGDAWIGRVLDERYEIESKLGEGGMGAVFIARHLKLQKQVALKVIRAELAGNGEVAIRFAREAMATAQFEHPHVASAIDYGGLPEGGAYFVMQLVRGRSLRERLESGAMPWRAACRIGAQIADALSAARAGGIVHRDLKPDNILVEIREDGSELARILDFGIAHVSPAGQAAPEGAMPNRELTRVGTVMGTPGYMAPEQAVGDRVDHRADLYALGVILWECVAGRELWNGPDITSILTKQVSEEPPALAEVAEDGSIPDALGALVGQLLARHPDMRPEHAGDVRDQLQALAQQAGEDGATPSSPFVERVSAVAGQLASQSQGAWERAATGFRTLPKRTRQLSLGGGVLALAALVALSLGGDDEKATGRAKGAEPANVVGSVVEAVEKAAEKVTPQMSAMLRPGVPMAIADEVHQMLEGDRRTERRDAAVVVLAHEPQEEVAPHLIAIAEFERARSCKARRKAIEGLAETGDDRVLPALERIRSAPKKGCGFLNLQDCHRCIRNKVREAMSTLSGEEPEPGGGAAEK